MYNAGTAELLELPERLVKKFMSIAPSFKEEARRIIEELPDDASWEDLMYRLYVRQAVKAGLEDVEAGRVVPDEEVRRQFGLR